MRRWLKNRCALASLEATRGALPDSTGSLASPAPLVRKPERGRSKPSKSPRLTARGSAQIDADRSLPRCRACSTGYPCRTAPCTCHKCSRPWLIAKTLPLGSVGYETATNEKGEL